MRHVRNSYVAPSERRIDDHEYFLIFEYAKTVILHVSEQSATLLVLLDIPLYFILFYYIFYSMRQCLILSLIQSHIVLRMYRHIQTFNGTLFPL